MNKSTAMMDERVRILIVDDELGARQTLQAILEDLYEVEAAADADQAERILESQSVQVLLTDYEMPGRSGMELIATVLDKYPQIVPILLTGYSTKREVRTADKDRNVFAVLSKPYEPAALLRSLSLAVAIAQLRILQQRSGGRKGWARVSSPTTTIRRILLVEDDTNNALTLAALLEDIGCAVDTATSLASARSQLSRAHYAVVLLDHHLGDGKGLELLPLLLGTPSPTPAVLLSGSPSLFDQSQGFAAIHTKGEDPEQLLSTVRRLIA